MPYTPKQETRRRSLGVSSQEAYDVRSLAQCLVRLLVSGVTSYLQTYSAPCLQLSEGAEHENIDKRLILRSYFPKNCSPAVLCGD